MFRTCLFAMILGFSVATPLAAQSTDAALPEVLLAAVKKISPRASIVTRMDVDLSSCPSAGNAPGIVANDFAGNGRRDYAVLVKTKVAKEETIWQDKKLREASLALVLFVDDGNGKYTRRILKRFDDFVPVGAMVKIQPPGAVVDRESNRRVAIPHAAVTLILCEKSAMTYYLEEGKVKSVSTAD